MRLPAGKERRGDRIAHAMRAVVCNPALIGEPCRAVRLIARKPLVPDAPADPVARAELRHRIEAAQDILYELQPL